MFRRKIFIYLAFIIAQNEAVFDRELVSVYFRPYVFPEDILFENGGYSVTELVQMLRTISSLFNRVMMGVIDDDKGNSINLIPKAVSQFNAAHKSSKDQSMELIMTHFCNPVNDQFENLNSVIELANEANNIYLGTVKRIILDSTNSMCLTQQNEAKISPANPITGLLDFLTQSKNKLSGGTFPYESGIMLNIRECSEVNKNLKGILEQVDFATFEKIPIDADYVYFSEIETFINWTISDIEDCKGVLSLINEDYHIDFLVVREEKPELFSQSSPDFVTFWNKMNDWAVKSNTSLVIYEAFDNFPTGDSSKIESAGLWKANGSQWLMKLGTDIVFEDKQGSLQNQSNQGGQFKECSRSNVVIAFNPLVSQDKDNSVFNYVNFAGSILMPPSTHLKIDNSTRLVIEIANWNAKQSSSSSQFNVIMQYSLEATSFPVAKAFADQANLIFKNTVNLILLRIESGTFLGININQIESQLLIAKTSVQDRLIEFGISLPIWVCGDEKFAILKQPLEHVTQVFLHHHPTPKMVKKGREFYLRVSFRYFRFCSDKLKELQSNITIGLELSWLSRKFGLFHDIENRHAIWSYGYAWAVINNVTIVLRDGPALLITDLTEHWTWCLEKDLKKSSHVQLSKKKQAQKSKTDIKSNPATNNTGKENETSFFWSLLVGVLMGCVVIGVGLGVIYAIRKRFRDNRRRQNRIEAIALAKFFKRSRQWSE